jgi:hypothetical protein
VDINWPAEETLKTKLKELQADPGKMALAQVEYWQLAGKTLINRVIIN